MKDTRTMKTWFLGETVRRFVILKHSKENIMEIEFGVLTVIGNIYLVLCAIL